MPNLSTPPAPVHPGTTHLLRLEGAALLLAMAAVYGLTGESWGMAAALFLLTRASGFITGQLMPINGGFVMN